MLTLSNRVPIVFVSSSVADADAFRSMAGSSDRLIVNMPDLTGARAAIEKLRPELVLCDTELEGNGSWRDLLTPGGPGLIVISARPDEALWAEVLNLGALDLLAKPFRRDEVERAVSLALDHAGATQ